MGIVSLGKTWFKWNLFGQVRGLLQLQVTPETHLKDINQIHKLMCDTQLQWSIPWVLSVWEFKYKYVKSTELWLQWIYNLVMFVIICKDLFTFTQENSTFFQYIKI